MNRVLLGCGAAVLLLLILEPGTVVSSNGLVALDQGVLIVGFFGGRFREKAYFQADPGSQQPPKVKF
jgi:hypothetical protein